MSRERCPFCGTDLYSRDVPRHVQERCKQARAECQGKNLMEECEKRRARQKGCQTLAQAFAKGKRARTDNGPAAGEDLLREAEDENLGQEGGVNLEVGGGILDPNANIGVEINNMDFQDAVEDNLNFGEITANVKEGVDGAMLMEKMGQLAIGLDQVCTRIGSMESALQDRALDIPGIAKPDDVAPEDDRLSDLKKCVSIDDILGLLCELQMDDNRRFLFCSLCLHKDAISEDQQAGKFSISFMSTVGETDDSGNQTREFRNLKGHVKSHIQTRPHTAQWDLWKQQEEEVERLRSKNELAGMRLARIAYEGFLRGRSLRDFEEQVLMAVQNGLALGDFHNSKDFPDKLMKYVYEEVRLLCENFITQRTVETGFLPPMNICADKGTVHHRSMQFTTAVVALANSDTLLTNLFLGQPIVRDHSANGLAQAIVDELTKHKISPSQVEGMSLDGQYIRWHVPEIVKGLMNLSSNFKASWDALHR